MTVKIQLEIKSCKECPHFVEKRMYTEDSFEHAYNWFCKKAPMDEVTGEIPKIAGYVEWHEEKSIKIPKWCPLRVDIS